MQNPLLKAIDIGNGIVGKVVSSPVGRVVNKASTTLPYVKETPFPTPFGKVRLPGLRIPELHPIILDERKRKALNYSLGIDVSGVVGIVPVVGDIVSDIIEDTYYEQIREMLSDAEVIDYVRFDKLGPSVVAMARTFMPKER